MKTRPIGLIARVLLGFACFTATGVPASVNLAEYIEEADTAYRNLPASLSAYNAAVRKFAAQCKPALRRNSLPAFEKWGFPLTRPESHFRCTMSRLPRPLSRSFIGFIGNSFTRLNPMLERGFCRLARENQEAMTPEAALFYNGRFSAVRTLSPKSPALIALSELPIEVPYHSVIGQQYPGPKERGSDGVVPYWSSHLDGAQSEVIVYRDIRSDLPGNVRGSASV